MDPVNNCNTINEISQPITGEFLRKEYGITEQYSPEDAERLLSLVRPTEEALRAARESAQFSEVLTGRLIRLVENSEVLHVRLDNIIESEKKSTEALQNLANSSSEIKAITSNIANLAKRFFQPVQNGMRNGFYFLTRHREAAAVLPGENQLAIEDNPENTISDTDPTNQTSGDEKKKLRRFTQILHGCRRIICFVCKSTKDLVLFIYKGINNFLFKITLWFQRK